MSSSDFIRDLIQQDLSSNRNNGWVITRFPPEPNGYLHIGHAKSICLNFGLAQEFSPNARCHLRFDDTNPTKEETEYVDSIMSDVRWLGFDWGTHLFYASDYFEKLYQFAESLILKGLAYVDHQTPEQMRLNRGTLTEPGIDSPYRNRSSEENLALFRAMRAGEFADSTCILRAKIDMAHPNLNLRDPAIYRILHAHHHRTGDQWCIYPMYDFAHPLSDALESITHSICTLEFEHHRPLYEWLIQNIDGLPGKPYQREFARLNLTYTVMSKRKLLRLVKENHVHSWDDPRMPTISGMRRRGVPATALRNFCKAIGLTKYNSVTDVALLEHHIRETLNHTAHRAMAVLNPIKVIIENYPEGQNETLQANLNPEDPESEKRQFTLSRELFIDSTDFLDEPIKGFHRLSPGAEVRLKNAFCIRCHRVENVDHPDYQKILYCTYDETTRHGVQPTDRPKVKGIIHWVDAKNCLNAEVRLYDRLFNAEDPEANGEDFLHNLNPNSLETLHHAKLECTLAQAQIEQPYQFERVGYFTPDKESTPQHLIFNRTISLKDSWTSKK